MFPDIDRQGRLDASDADPGKQFGDEPVPVGRGDGLYGDADHEDDPDGVHGWFPAEPVGNERQQDLADELPGRLDTCA